MTTTLHGYWRSGAAYRVRLALNIKQIPYEQVTHDLRKNEQAAAAFLALQPQGLVPALVVEDGAVLTQSLAILEWLEEAYPSPRLLPSGLTDRAAVRAMAALVACDIHPLNNLRVLNALKSDFTAGEPQVQRWIARWIEAGFGALESLIAQHGAGYCFGDSPTIADCCLIPQVYSARRFNVDLAAFPHITAVAETAGRTAPFVAAEPSRQPDSDEAAAPSGR